LEGFLHLEVGLSLTLDSLLFVVANHTGVHGLQDSINMYVLLYGVRFNEQPCPASAQIAVAQVVASVIWDARDIFEVLILVAAKDLVAESCGQFEIIWSLGQQPRGGPAAQFEALHHTSPQRRPRSEHLLHAPQHLNMVSSSEIQYHL
jgi:hypothetical protein